MSEQELWEDPNSGRKVPYKIAGCKPLANIVSGDSDRASRTLRPRRRPMAAPMTHEELMERAASIRQIEASAAAAVTGTRRTRVADPFRGMEGVRVNAVTETTMDDIDRFQAEWAAMHADEG